MSPSPEKMATLSILPQRPIGPKDLPRRIEITDGTLSLIGKGFGELKDLKLRAGVYQARVESTEQPFEQMIILAPGEEVSVVYPLNKREVLASAAPVPGSDAMHETMRGPLEKAVALPATKTRSSRFLLMATHSGRGRASIDLTGFRLLDAEGNEVERLSEKSIAGKQNAFRLFSRDVNEGGLMLEGLAENFGPGIRIRQPLWCGAGWCTLIFVGVNAETGVPDLNTVSVYLWRIGSSFAPEATDHANSDDLTEMRVMESQRYTELALHSLVNGRSLLSMEAVDTNLLVEKFHNPMLGILGCHLLLQQQAKDEKLVRTVITNLNRLVPDHPDVIALRIMTRQSGLKDLTSPLPPAAWPPMLRRGFMAVRDEDWEQSGTVRPGSLFDRVRTHAVNGGVWTRWIREKNVKQFAEKVAADFRRMPIWQKLAESTGAYGPVSRNVVSYTNQMVRAGTKPEIHDLKWSGLSRRQAATALRLLTKELTSRPQLFAKQSAVNKKTSIRPIVMKTPQSSAPTKAELLASISKDTELSKKQVGAVLDSLSASIKKNLRSHGLFTFPGLLKMRVVKQSATKAREGVNPFNGEKMMFKAKRGSKKVRIAALKSLKEFVK